jgi:hypothetical protein
MSSISSNKQMRNSASGALYAVAGALETLVQGFNASDASIGPTTPQRCTQAIQTAEEEEEGFSDNEFAEIA